MFGKTPSPLDILITISFILGILLFLTYMSGWYELAKLYRTDLQLLDSNIAARVKNYRCRIGINANSPVSGPFSIAFLDTGIYLHGGSDSDSTFGAIYSPLLIPWQAVNRYELIENEYCFYFGSPTISILHLGINRVRELEQLSSIQVSDRLNSN